MTEQEFQERFETDRHSGVATWVAGGISIGQAVALEGGHILLQGGGKVALSNARFTPPPWELGRLG